MISVSELNEKIKAVLETTFMHIVVEGEVSSATYHSSGHLYFSIKDEKSTLKCVMWKGSLRKLKFRVEKGEHIVIDGSIGVYTPRGEYQFIATNIEPYGRGNLALAFEQLKKKLEKKGYFKEEIKKSLPKFPKKIAVVTALNAAALQDILKVAKKRWPLCEFVVIDTLVQGEQAAEQIAKGVAYADSLECDVILVTRGGGSQEDLWAFNEEAVANAIFNASVPVVSAVGHEVDFLISDFVSDLRAPTPSAAIEMILPDMNEYLYTLDEQQNRVIELLNLKLTRSSQELEYLKQRLSSLSPKEKLYFYSEEFRALQKSLRDIIKHKLTIYEESLKPLRSGYYNSIDFLLRKKENSLENIQEQLLLNNPSKRVKEGFVEVTKRGKRIDICNVKEGDKLALVNSQCRVDVVVE